MNETRQSPDLLTRYPLPDTETLERDYRAAMARFDRKVVVLDDDPTGVQTVHGVHVYTDWTQQSFDEGFAEDSRLFFILTNSRAMSRETTVREHELMARRIAEASRKSGRDFVVISRGDSTLRGHYPTEPDVLRRTLEAGSGIAYDGEILYPFFPEGGRYTVGNVHYVREGDVLTPAGQTEFARDKTFGYHSSDLCEWVEEKTGGTVRAQDCICIRLEDLRALNYRKITEQLLSARGGTRIIVNSADYCDVRAFTVAFIDAVMQGRHFLIRSAAAITKVLGGVSDRPLLRRGELIAPGTVPGGILLVGSHVQKTTDQLNALRGSGLPVNFMEFDVARALEPNGLTKERDRLTAAAEEALRGGQTVCVYTSRRVLVPEGADREQALSLSVSISDALTGIIGRLSERPAFIIAKGGITSSDVGTKALRVRRATVMGQIKPGIPVWMTGSESKFPDMPYVIFPGNVGNVGTLAEITAELMGKEL